MSMLPVKKKQIKTAKMGNEEKSWQQRTSTVIRANFSKCMLL